MLQWQRSSKVRPSIFISIICRWGCSFSRRFRLRVRIRVPNTSIIRTRCQNKEGNYRLWHKKERHIGLQVGSSRVIHFYVHICVFRFCSRYCPWIQNSEAYFEYMLINKLLSMARTILSFDIEWYIYITIASCTRLNKLICLQARRAKGMTYQLKFVFENISKDRPDSIW